MARKKLSRTWQPRFTERVINEQIKHERILVVLPDNKKEGPMSRVAALSLAQKAQLDLVLMSKVNQQGFVVCRLLDYAKFRYEHIKKEKQLRKKQALVIKKEIRLKVQIAPSDLQVKINRARAFLKKKYYLKLGLRFRGREVSHPEFGYQTMRNFLAKIADLGIISEEITQDRLFLRCEVAPLVKKHQKLPSKPSFE